MTDATIGAPAADADADADGDATEATGHGTESDDAVVTVLVPESDGWSKYRLVPGSKLTVDGLNGEPAAIVEADPDPDD